MASDSDRPDRIERTVVLKAPRERVWRAISNAEEFGTWFRVNLKGQVFAPGKTVRGRLEVPGFTHVVLDLHIDRVEPMERFSYHWHPYAVEPGTDYTQEPTTLVTFTLKDAKDGATELTIVETGFDKVPAHRRQQAYRMNSEGWDGQLRNIAAYVVA
jgi:uncharacterized protein YndB with AHSA1/START domain